MRVYVNTEDKRWGQYKIDFKKIANMAVGAKYKNAEVSITLVDDSEIRKINKKYRGIDKPTNVLSFELGDDVLLGDIFISFDTVKKEANQENISVAEHTAHMIVHGMLHLQGYDHINDRDAEKMELKETVILKKLGYKNPYATENQQCNNESCCPGGATIIWWKRFVNSSFGRAILYILCAMIATLGFAPFGLWWATLCGIGGAYLLTIKYLSGVSVWRRFWALFTFGAFYAMAMFWWVLNSIYVVPELASQFAVWTIPALIGIGIVGGLIFNLPFMAICSSRLNPACRPFLFASIWTLVLWAREWIFTGFPWNPIANISFTNLYVANSMSLYGALGQTFVIIGIISAICEIIRNRKNGLNWLALGIFVMFGVCGVLYGIRNIHMSAESCVKQMPVIRIVQPAQSAAQKATHSRAEALQNANNNLRKMMSIAVAEGNYDMVVFPETSYPYVVMNGDDIEIARMINRPIIMGSNYYKDGNLYNSLLLVNPNGDVSHVYHKSHLVPFGEYRPFGNLIPTPGQLTPGNGPELIDIKFGNNKVTFAPAVCYEIIFSDSLVPYNTMPDFIINITNDNWFGKTPGTYQHLDMVRRYAIESGIPIVRANYSGISAFVAADGNVVAEIPIGVAGHIDGTVCGTHKTAYRVIGRNLWMIIILIMACMSTIWIADMSRRNKN